MELSCVCAKLFGQKSQTLCECKANIEKVLLICKVWATGFNKLSSLAKFTKSLHVWRKVYLHLNNIEEVLDFRKLLDWMG